MYTSVRCNTQLRDQVAARFPIEVAGLRRQSFYAALLAWAVDDEHTWARVRAEMGAQAATVKRETEGMGTAMVLYPAEETGRRVKRALQQVVADFNRGGRRFFVYHAVNIIFALYAGGGRMPPRKYLKEFTNDSATV